MEKINIVLLGPPGAGKTQLFYRFIDEDRCDTTPSTGTSSRMIKNGNDSYWIYDTAGQEMYDSISNKYVRDASIVILMSDGSDDSYDELSKKHFQNVKDTSSEIKIINVMNKSDLLNNDTARKADQRAEEIAPGTRYFLVSALNNDNVSALKACVFEECKNIKSSSKGNPKLMAFSPGSGKEAKKSSCC